MKQEMREHNTKYEYGLGTERTAMLKLTEINVETTPRVEIMPLGFVIRYQTWSPLFAALMTFVNTTTQNPVLV